MEQHPIPRQITTFEFKLVGFMTLKQFLYLLLGFSSAFVVFRLVPVPVINILLAVLLAGAGVLLAFIPYNDRPLDVLAKNLIKRLISPTQYYYKKQNPPIYFLENLYFTSDPHKVFTHIESQEKLARYLSEKKPHEEMEGLYGKMKQAITELLHQPLDSLKAQKTAPVSEPSTIVVPPPAQEKSTPPRDEKPTTPEPQLTGVVKNSKQTPLPGILIYIKDPQGTPLRLLKTNPHGVFATYNALPAGDYTFEIKDPKGSYFFDTMNIALQGREDRPFEFYSRELM